MDVTERAVDVLAGLRPQGYALVRSDRVTNPIVEPQWAGVRVLAAVEDRAVDRRDVDLRDEDGEPFLERPEVLHALGLAVRARAAILDGWLTKQATGDIVYRPPSADVPSPAAILAKPFIGIRRDRAKEVEVQRKQLTEAAIFSDDEPVAFVATDLLWLDGESLLDVPLLERKRLLESVLEPSELARLGTYVRPPLHTWISTWRRLGFFGLTYRAANSRYHPGEERDEWVVTPMPRR